MEIVVNGRNSEISDRFRGHISDKLQRIEKYDQSQKIVRVEVEVTHEANPRQHENAARVEITLRSSGPVIRAEAASTDQHSALDAAVDKLESRLRRFADRKRISRGQHRPESLNEALAAAASATGSEPVAGERDVAGMTEDIGGGVMVQGEAPIVVREKSHAAPAMTLEQALCEMELVGHSFYLFLEKDSMRPSVVYLRRAYDYGVIHLDVEK